MEVKRGFTIAANVILLIICYFLFQNIMVDLDEDNYLGMGLALIFLSGIIISVLTISASSSKNKSLRIVSLIFMIILTVFGFISGIFFGVIFIIAFIFQLIALVLESKE